MVTGLTAGDDSTTFRVAAVSGATTGVYAAEVDAMTTAAPAAAPSDLTAMGGDAQVTLSWTAYSGTNTGFSVYYHTSTGFDPSTTGTEFMPSPALNASATGVVVTGLTAGTQYYFRVAAVNGATTGVYAAEVDAMTTAAPAAPTNLTPGTVTETSVALSWTAPSGLVTGYEIEYADNSGFASLMTATSTSTSYTVTGLTNGVLYFFRVAATNSSGTSAYFPGPSDTPVSARPMASVDYDTDNDGLIEVSTLVQLNAIRYDLDGDGAVEAGDQAAYGVAFPATSGGSNYGAITCQNAGGTDVPCTGYELASNLDFAGSRWADGATGVDAVAGGWEPIGIGLSPSTVYAATFEGDGYTISNLFINRSTQYIGLFGYIGSGATVRNLGLVGGSVTSTSAGIYAGTGGLAGLNQGMISACYATVTVTATGNNEPEVGGLVGNSSGTISACYATGATSASSFSAVIGGLVGFNDGTISACYAIGAVTGDPSSTTGGLSGQNESGGTVSNSYFDSSANSALPAIGNDNGTSTNVSGKTAAELQEETGYSGIYSAWDVDIDNLDGDSDLTTDADDPWDFGTNSQHPVLKGFDIALQRTAFPVVVLPPAAPTNLTSGTVTETSVALSWTAYSGTNTGFKVYYSEVASFTPPDGMEFMPPSALAATATGVDVTGLTAGTLYYFRVAAVNGVTTGVYAAEVSATTMMSAPLNLTPGTVTETSVALSWTAYSGTNTGFKVYYSEVASFTPPDGMEFMPPSALAATATGVDVTGLTAGTLYYFRVAAVNGVTTGVYAAEVSATTMMSAPLNLTPGTVTETSVALSWTAYSGTNTGFKVYYSEIASFTPPDGTEFTPPSVLAATATGVDVTGLTAGTLYYFRVAAVNGVTTGVYAAEVSATTMMSAPLNLTPGTVTETSVALSWTAYSGTNTGFKVYYSEIASFTPPDGTEFTPPSVLAATATGVDVTGLTAGTLYYFRVAAVNGVTTGVYAAEVSATTMMSAPLNLTPGTVTETSVALSWTAYSGTNTGFSVYYHTSTGFTPPSGTEFVPTPPLGANATEIVVTGLTAGTTYYFRVAAVNGATTGVYAAEVDAMTTAAPAAAPSDLTAMGGDAQVTLSWTAYSGTNTGFSVYYHTSTGFDPSTTGTEFMPSPALNASATGVVVTGLTAGTQYYFRVAAVNGATTGVYAAEVDAMTTAAPAAAPSDLTAMGGDAQVTLSWTAYSGTNTGFSVYYHTSTGFDPSTTGTEFMPSPALNASATGVVVTGLTAGTQYYFRVAAVNGATTGVYAAEVDAMTTAAPPDSPTNLTAMVRSQILSVDLSWTAPSGLVTGYAIEYADSLRLCVFDDGDLYEYELHSDRSNKRDALLF